MTYTTSGAAVVKCGPNVSTAIPDVNGWGNWISGACATINVSTRKNWSDDYAALNVDVKHMLDDVASSLVAINAITYDMDAIGRGTAEDMILILRDQVQSGIRTLEEQKHKDFIAKA